MSASVRALGYTRVSSEEQRQSGLGIAAQREAIAAAAKRLGVELVLVEADEGVSGALPPHERPAFARVLEELRRGDVLLVAKRDRLWRDYVEVGLLERQLRRRGVQVVSAAGEGSEARGSSALLQKGLHDLLAGYERELIRERTTAALRAKRARGERAGAVPFGFDLAEGGRLVPNEDEQRALAFLLEERARGKGAKALAKALNARGFKPKHAARWSYSSVESVLATVARHAPRS